MARIFSFRKQSEESYFDCIHCGTHKKPSDIGSLTTIPETETTEEIRGPICASCLDRESKRRKPKKKKEQDRASESRDDIWPTRQLPVDDPNAKSRPPIMLPALEVSSFPDHRTATIEEARSFVEKVTRPELATKNSRFEDFFNSADPLYIRTPNNLQHRLDWGNTSDFGTDQMFKHEGQKKSLKAWVRGWATHHPEEASSILLPDKEWKSGQPIGPDRAKEQSYRGSPGDVLNRIQITPEQTSRPVVEPVSTRPKGKKPIVETPSRPLAPITRLPEFSATSENPSSVVAIDRHDAPDDPITHLTNDPLHHCEEDRPICLHCGTSTRSNELNELGVHKYEFRNECNRRAQALGRIPM